MCTYEHEPCGWRVSYPSPIGSRMMNFKVQTRDRSSALRLMHKLSLILGIECAGRSYRAAPDRADSTKVLRVYLKTPNAPGQRVFSRCAAPFFLEIRQYSCEKMSCAAQKFLAAGHIMSLQIHPRVYSSNSRRTIRLLKSSISNFK